MANRGENWIGEIPKGWRKKKIAHIFKNIGSGTTPRTSNKSFYDKEDYPWLNTGDLNDSYVQETKKKISKAAIDENTSLKVFEKNALVMAMYGATIGKLGIITFETYTNQACCVMSMPTQDDVKFVFYWLLVFRKNIITLAYGGTQPNISQETIKNIYVSLPSINEQQKIAAFLDEKVAHIDNIIEDTKQSIENLKAYKQSLITETVTKGLDPDVEMKDSGFEWIEDIPKHWNLIKTKYILGESGIKIGPFGSALRSNEISSKGPIKVYAQANLIRDDFDYGEKFIGWEKFKQLSMYEVDKGDILISMMGTIGRVSIFPESAQKGIMDSHLTKMNLHHQLVFSDYYKYVFDSSLTTKTQLDLESKGSIMSGLNSTIIKNIMICLPPISEQKRITEYLDNQLSLLNDLTESKVKLITELESYKKSLIYEYVTGKKEVK